MIDRESPDPGCADATTNGDHSFAPCSCCMALAQVRQASYSNPGTGPGNGHGHAGGHAHGPASHPGVAGGNGTDNGNGTSAGNGHGKNSGKAKPIVFKMPQFGSKKQNGQAEHKAEDAESAVSTKKSDQEKESPDGMAAKESSADDWHDDLGLPKVRKLWQGLDGKAVMTFGVLIPSFMAVAGCLSAPKRITLLLLNHPVETICEISLVALIPLAILFIWSQLCKNNVSYSIGRGAALGASIGSALIIAGVCIAALFCGSKDLASAIGTEFTAGFCWFAFLALGAATTGAFLVDRLRLARDFSASRMQVLALTSFGVVLAAVTFITAEARPWSIRLAEMKAVSTQAAERNAGLHELRAMDPERELRMECSDDRAAGLSGLFMPLKPTSQRQLYFAVTGKPYSFREFNDKDLSSMPDDDLKSRMVGELVPGLSLIRSTMDGAVHPFTLSSTVNWTFVYKNGTTSPQEVRSELLLPPGAVITGLSMWRHGEREEATVAAAGKAEGYTDSNWRQVSLDSPAVLSDLGHGRMLLHCYPVSQEEEMKVSLTMVIPLKPEDAKKATLALPAFIAANFDFKGNNHLVKLHSPGELASTMKNFTRGLMSGGDKTISGSLTDEQLESTNLNITAARSEYSKPAVVLDKIAVALAQADEKKRQEKIRRANEVNNAQAERQIIVMIDGSKGVNSQIADVTRALDGKPAGRIKHKTVIKTIPPQYVVENIKPIAAPAPKHLVVVVDSSAAVKKYSGELAESLAKLPAGIPADLVIASQEKETISRPVPLAQGIAALRKNEFAGGQNNLQAVVKAAETAGEQAGGAVLWVHGPQPSLNEEIYIMSQYVATPAFYELQVGSGDTDTFDFFKNHSEIGPFTQVPRNTNSVSTNLASFFSKWRPEANDYAVSLSQTTTIPDSNVLASEQEGRELLALHANQECARLIATRHIRKAARIAVAYGLVTPVSCALVMNNQVIAEDAADDNGTAPGASEGLGQLANATSSTPAASSDGAPVLQGATNGTIGPQGMDATFVTGVNTAGAVRVNNLANLEALLNIIANLSEIGCALVGVVILIHGFAVRGPQHVEVMGRYVEVSPGQRIALGIVLVLVGLAVPGLLNWFVASARDANLFS